MSNPAESSTLTHPVAVAQLNARKVLRFDLVPDADIRAAIAAELGLIALRKFRFRGELRPLGRSDWDLHADLGASVVQACTITLDPVPARIDEAVRRTYLAHMPEPDGLEVEMPEDDTQEQLPAILDLGAVALEALALALPQWPRADGAALAEDGRLQITPPGQAPIDDAQIRPFASLAALRDKLGEPKG